MNLTLHIIRKDLRALRWGMLLWIAACLTHLGLRLAQHARGDTALLTPFWAGLETSRRWDYTALVVLPVLLIPLLLHLDPLRGPLSFWKTLPISRRRLIVAKTITLAAFFVALPFMCEVVYFVQAGLSAVLAQALADWAWRFLPGLAALVLGCFFTRSLKTGVPCVAALLWLAAQFLGWPYGGAQSARPQVASAVPEPGVIAAPAGVRLAIDPQSVEFLRTNQITNDGPGKTRRIEERLAVALKVTVGGLPENVLIGAVGLRVDAIHLPGRVLNAGQTNGYYRPGIPAQEQRTEIGSNQNGDDELGAGNWKVNTNYLPLAGKELAPSGALVEGVARVTLVRRHPVATLPLENGAQWQPGLHRFKLSEVTPAEARQVNYRGTLATILADPRGATGGLALTPEQNFVVWLEHHALPFRKYLQFLPASAWQQRESVPANGLFDSAQLQNMNYAAAPVPALTDLTRSRRRTLFAAAFDPILTLGQKATPLTVARFAEEQAQVRNWHLAIVTYEELGTVELPLKAVVPRPQFAREDDDEDKLKAPPPSLGTLLEAVKIPAQPSRAEAGQILARIAEFTATRSENELYRHQNLLLKKLAALGADNLEVLLSAATPALRRPPFSENAPRQQREWLLAAENRQRHAPFWHWVLLVACDLARPGDRETILRFHSPTVNLLRAIEPHAWSAAALPAMCTAAASEPVPDEWQEFFASHPGPPSQAALLAQIRQRTMPPGRVAQFIERGVLPGREAASALWETVLASTGYIEELTPTFPLAVKHGVEIIPRDLLRLLRLRAEDLNRANNAPFKTLQSAFVQSFALRSGCPPTVAEAAPWLEENALNLQFNDATGRYEPPGQAAPVNDLSAWGRFTDPLGLGRARVEGASLVLTGAGAGPGAMAEFPRVVRELEGDFTAEVTVEPGFDLAPAWSRQESGIFESGGLMLVADDRRALRWEHGLYKTNDGHELREEAVRGGKNLVTQRASPAWDRALPLRLRLARHGDFFSTAWSQGGGAWVESPAFFNPGWPRKIGLAPFVVNQVIQPFSVRFTDFKIEPSAVAPTTLLEVIGPLAGGGPTPPGTVLPGWGTVENPSGAGLCQVREGMLSIETASGADFNVQQTRTAPCVLRKVDGDFTFEVTIAPTAKKYWTSAEVLLEGGPDCYFRVGLAAERGDKPFFTCEYAERGRRTAVVNMEARRDLTKPIRLRLQRRGWLLTLAHQQDGGEWTEFYPLNLRFWPAKIRAGVVSLNTSGEPFTASFSDLNFTDDTSNR